MNAPQRSRSGFYKGVAILFFALGAVFIWAAIRQHSWYYGAMAIITVLNGLMSTLKSMAVRDT